MTFLSTLRLKFKLLVAFLITLVPLVAIGGFVVHGYIVGTYNRAIQESLRSNAGNVLQMVETTAEVAIRNYLRAVAEQNLGVLTQYWEVYQSGRWHQKHDAIDAARLLLSSQRVGNSGYIYCVNSRGEIVHHPHKEVEGSNLQNIAFIREQMGRRQGYMEYEWQNPGESEVRAKALYMVYFEPLDWIISVTAYREEFNRLVPIEDFRGNVQSLRFGVSGYAFVLGGGGELLIHPLDHLSGTIADYVSDSDPPLDQVTKTKAGNFTYNFNDPATGRIIRRIAYLDYIPDFDWYVGTSHSLEDVYTPLRTIRAIILFSSLCLVLIAALVASWFASYANTHIDRLIAAFKSGASGHFKERLTVYTKDEFGKLAQYFNLFMERLESYQRGMLEEIDKRREAQNAVYASEQRIKNLVRNAPVVFWAIDREGRLTFYEGALPLPVNAAEDPDPGHPLALLWSQWEEMPAHIDAVLHGQSGFVLIDKADYALEIHYNPLWTGDKTVEGAVGVVIDVTSRLQTERKLDLSEQERQKLVMAVEQGAEIVMITDRDGIIQYVNPAFERSSGYVKSEVLGKRPAILKSGRHDNRFYDTLWRTIGAGEVWSGRFTNRKKDGALYYEDATIAPLFDESGRIVHYVASKRDVTAEIDLERQLQRAERMKAIGTLAGGIAHDFNNILTGIMGFTEVCLFEAPEDSRMHQRLDKVMQACLRAKELIGHIQAFSRQDRLTPLEMMPAPIVNEAIKLVRASFPQSIVFMCDIHQVSAIRAVPAQLHQIVMNLCTNACHAMQDTGGELTVVLRQVVLDASSSKHLLDVSAGVYIQLSVGDTGHGISAAIIGQIFDPYFTTKTEDQGTGLGLSVVHGIVRKMGGAIKVDSEPGLGTTFTVLLPGIEKSGAMAEPPMNGGSRSGGQSVMVVDDEAYVLESTREALESLGYRVTACSAAADALARFQSQPRQFDLLITDFSLPGTNGARLAEDMLKIRPDLPVIISTGFSQNDSIEALARQYVVDWIHKPIIRSDLAAKVHAGLKRPQG